MYLVKEDLPESCIRCPFQSKCDVWSAIIEQMSEEQFMDFPTPLPTQYPCCKLINPLPHFIMKFWRKWIRGECRNICIFCRHKKRCDI